MGLITKTTSLIHLNMCLKHSSIAALSFFLSFFAGTVAAQDYYSSAYQYKPVSLGITFAPNLSWLRYGDNNDYSNDLRFGFSYGLLADFAFSENYYFSSGLLINTLNAKSSYLQQGTSTPPLTYHYRIQYAEIPLSVKLKSTQRYFRSYYGQFGFSTGLRVSAKQQDDVTDGRTSMGSDANFLRLALQIGGGVEWQLDHNLVMMTGLSFNNGFTRAIKAGEPRSSYVAFNFGIFF